MLKLLQTTVLFSLLTLGSQAFSADKLDGLSVSQPAEIYTLINGTHKQLFNPYCLQRYIKTERTHPLKVAAGFVVTKIDLQRITKVNELQVEKAYLQATLQYTDTFGNVLEPATVFRCLFVK